MIWLTKFVIRSLELAGGQFRSRKPKHLLTGKRGEIEAYFHLRSLGYKIVATNFRVPYNRGEIDLIGWDNGVLCFIEVKTRTSADFAPPSTAVDREKKRHILSVARQYVRRLSGRPASVLPLRYRQHYCRRSWRQARDQPAEGCVQLGCRPATKIVEERLPGPELLAAQEITVTL